ncbi:hypothetical protein R83H12_02155 [Fibrobacteria bacterium R8-3-H12]
MAENYVNYSQGGGSCPNGWHIPSQADWVSLINFVGGTRSLIAIDFGGTDDYGFAAMLYGFIGTTGKPLNSGEYADFWTNDKTGIRIGVGNYSIGNYTASHYQLSVRCLQNPPLPTYTITYNANNGSGASAAQTKTHDIALTLSSITPTRTGYTFAGWNTVAGGGGTSYAAGASYTTNSDVTLYAQWSSLVVSNCNDIAFKAVEIGTQTWMAENLNCNISDSKCYDNNEANCDIYGRLYNWAAAMALPSHCNSNLCASQVDAKHRGICPSGWHIPSDADWDKLLRYADGTSGTDSPYSSSTAGVELKATKGWESLYYSTDAIGFSALPGGSSRWNNYFSIGKEGYWWSATDGNDANASRRRMSYNESGVYRSVEDKDYLSSVRCVQD